MAKKKWHPAEPIDLPAPFLPNIPMSQLLVADSEADMVRHAIVRAVLLNELVNDQRVLGIFDDWSRRTGVGRLAEEAATALEKAAVRCGLSERAEFFEDGRTFSVDAETRTSLEEARRAVQAIGERVTNHGDLDLPSVLAGLAVKHLNLPWPWVPIELWRAYSLLLEAHVTGRRFELGVSASALPMSDDDDTSVELPAAPLEDQLRRLDELRAGLRARAAAQQPRRGRLPKSGGERLEEYARWFYRRRACGASIRQLALAYHEEHHARLACGPDHDRKLIRHGIKTAERILDFAAYRFREAPLGK